MKNEKKIEMHDIIAPLEKSEKSGFKFIKLRNGVDKLSARIEELIKNVGGVKPFWILMSIIGIPLTIIFGIYEANMAKSAIAGLIDPYSEGTVDPRVINLIGAGLAIFAIFIGHICKEGLEFEKNEITGRKKLTLGASFYVACIAMLAYLGFQYYLVFAAGEGNSEFNYMAYIATIVALLEFFVGFLVLGKSISYIWIFFSRVAQWLKKWKMDRMARRASEFFNDHNLMAEHWNKNNPDDQYEVIKSKHIEQALDYYKGIYGAEEDDEIDDSPNIFMPDDQLFYNN